MSILRPLRSFAAGRETQKSRNEKHAKPKLKILQLKYQRTQETKNGTFFFFAALFSIVSRCLFLPGELGKKETPSEMCVFKLLLPLPSEIRDKLNERKKRGRKTKGRRREANGEREFSAATVPTATWSLSLSLSLPFSFCRDRTNVVHKRRSKFAGLSLCFLCCCRRKSGEGGRKKERWFGSRANRVSQKACQGYRSTRKKKKQEKKRNTRQ